MIIFAQYFGHLVLLSLELGVSALAARRFRLSRSRNRTLYGLTCLLGLAISAGLADAASMGSAPGLRQAALVVLLILTWAGVRHLTGWAAQFRYSGLEKVVFRASAPVQTLQSRTKDRT